MADYPDTIYNPRVKENKSGVVFDPTKKTVLYAEDLQALDDEVVAIETDIISSNKVLGCVPFPGLFSPKRMNKTFAKDSNGYYYTASLVPLNGTSSAIAVWKSLDLKTWIPVGVPFTLRTTLAGSFISSNSPIRLFIAPNGNIGLLCYGYSDTNTTVYNLLFAVFNGSTWTAEWVSSETTSGYNPSEWFDIVADSSSNWHVVWCQKHSASTSYSQVRYRKRTAGSWDAIVNIGSSPTAANDFAHILIWKNNRPSIVYKGNSGYTHLAEYNGATWDDYSQGTSRDIYQISVDSNGNIWCAASTGLVKISSSRAFSTVTGFATNIIYGIHCSSDGYIYLNFTNFGSTVSPYDYHCCICKYDPVGGTKTYSQPFVGGQISDYYNTTYGMFGIPLSVPQVLLLNNFTRSLLLETIVF